MVGEPLPSDEHACKRRALAQVVLGINDAFNNSVNTSLARDVVPASSYGIDDRPERDVVPSDVGVLARDGVPARNDDRISDPLHSNSFCNDRDGDVCISSDVDCCSWNLLNPENFVNCNFDMTNFGFPTDSANWRFGDVRSKSSGSRVIRTTLDDAVTHRAKHPRTAVSCRGFASPMMTYHSFKQCSLAVWRVEWCWGRTLSAKFGGFAESLS